ncbi:MAG: hypothetical protein Q9219_000975 [cf. Caloplaca sp. 3 TL-2023]
MARLNTLSDDEHELPDLWTILAKNDLVTDRSRSSVGNDAQGSKHHPSWTESRNRQPQIVATDATNLKKHTPLKIAHVDSLLISLTNGHGASSRSGYLRSRGCSIASSNAEDDISDHLSDFIVPDSSSDESYEEYASKKYRSPTKHKWRGKDAQSPFKSISPHQNGKKCREGSRNPVQKTSRSGDQTGLKADLKSSAWQGLTDDQMEEFDSILKFSPPRLKSPLKSPPINQASTPPASPSKNKLLSPGKKARIPPSPHRPSIDAFWSQEVINDWNDQHSPKKRPNSSRSRKFDFLLEEDEDNLSPCEAVRRSPSKSPVKENKQAADKRKAFNQRKYALAISFLQEIDQTVGDSQIATLTESTGGVRLVWNNKLQSTAGRASWKREVIRSKNTDGTVCTAKHRHHASIELAEKVIDDEGIYPLSHHRLINVIAHEYCHLLNFMVSNVKDQPHGTEFKKWAKKCSAAFAHRGVNVTTKHTYEITYKYVWACTHCGTEYKRHSKSIDPARHSCGKCKEKLVQVKPVPRGEGKGPSEYQKYVKENYARVKKESPEMSMGEVMAMLGREFRQIKEKRQEEGAMKEDKQMEPRSLEADNDATLDTMVRKLDFLSLMSE